jgi:NAD(P)-dependent dehydrogenase (short-subunit alcohol dehydrogenase family)
MRLAEEGAIVYLTDINLDGVKETAQLINEAGGQAFGLRHDVTSESDWDDIFQHVIAEHGRLDIIVNNAGVAILGPVETQTSEKFHRQIDVNMNSVFYGTKRAIEAMRSVGQGGAILNMSSVVGLVGVPGCLAYAASKGGVRLMSKTAAIETASQNIRINTVHPGMIKTNIQEDALKDNPDFYDQVSAAIPMGYFGDPIDVANLCLFLASDEASYITGAEFTVDGGMTAQ